MSEIAIRLARGFNGVQRLANRRVADRMEVHLEALSVELRHGRLELLRLDHRYAARLARDQVGLEQGRRVILHDTVLHDLDGPGIDVALRVFGPQALHPFDLLEALPALPPDRADDVQRQLPGIVELSIGLEVVFVDVRILDRGDAEAVQVFDGVTQARGALLVAGRRHLGSNELARAFLEAADGRTGLRVAVDAAVARIGRVFRNARDFECLGIDPNRVPVRAREDHRRVRHHGVGPLAAREWGGSV